MSLGKVPGKIAEPQAQGPQSCQTQWKRQECTIEWADLKSWAVKPRDRLQTPTTAHVHNRESRWPALFHV